MDYWLVKLNFTFKLFFISIIFSSLDHELNQIYKILCEPVLTHPRRSPINSTPRQRRGRNFFFPPSKKREVLDEGRIRRRLTREDGEEDCELLLNFLFI